MKRLILSLLISAITSPAAASLSIWDCAVVNSKKPLDAKQTLTVLDGVGFLMSRPGQRFFHEEVGPGFHALLDGTRGDDIMLKCE